MTKIAVAVPTVWVSTLWGEAWSVLILLLGLSILALVAAWKMREIEAEEKA
jgi:hypothetical protein